MILDVSHSGWLVLASIAVALMASFTGLSLTKGASAAAPAQRKLIVVMAAIALGGGIWSMHFVAMLGLQLPVLFYYDALVTLASALIAILMVGLALLVLHFARRTRGSIVAAGTIVGLGIALMHFIGMTGMRLCRPVNGPGDYVLSSVAAVVLSILAIGVAYGARTRRNILLGTVCFGMAVVAVHFLAIAQTDFVKTGTGAGGGPLLSNETLALGVTVAAFLICGTFLLTVVTFLDAWLVLPDQDAEPEPDETETPEPEVSAGVPFERDGRTHFAERREIAAIRAEGHYTLLYVGAEKRFCPWSISEADERLAGSGFMRVHRSYLVNPAQVSGFERLKDTGVLYFDAAPSIGKVPVSRSRLAEVRETLGL